MARPDTKPAAPISATAVAVDVDAPVELREIGGLGTHLVMQMTAWHCYRRDDGRNRYSVVWRCEGAPG